MKLSKTDGFSFPRGRMTFLPNSIICYSAESTKTPNVNMECGCLIFFLGISTYDVNTYITVTRPFGRTVIDIRMNKMGVMMPKRKFESISDKSGNTSAKTYENKNSTSILPSSK